MPWYKAYEGEFNLKKCGTLYVNETLYVTKHYMLTYIRRTYETASRPNCWDGILVLLDGYYASQWLRYCKSVKLLWRGKIKQMEASLKRKYVRYYMLTRHIQTDIWDGILACCLRWYSRSLWRLSCFIIVKIL